MKIDRLILKDIWGPWLFGVGLFSALLMAATYLGRVAGYIVDGVPPNLVLELIGLLMPAILVKTFSMSVLLATLLGFGRLSSDSELVALRAGGASLYRIVFPVALFSALIALVTFGFNEGVVPSASRRSAAITTEILSKTKIVANQPIARTIVTDGKLRAAIAAENVNPMGQTLEGVTLIAYDDHENPSFVLFANEMNYRSDTNWSVRGNIRLIRADGSLAINLPDKQGWPSSEIKPLKQNFAELTADRNDDFDSKTMLQLRTEIAEHKLHRDMKSADINNYEYGYWNKISVPLAAIVFGILGSVLGIRNHRTGTASGFALAIAIIFAYVTLANFMNVWALGGFLPSWAASFSPVAIGAVASGVIMWRRNG